MTHGRPNDSGGTPSDLVYRADLDGLRAIAIASVVMFHAGFNDWKGGYVGVDVFFVISGFLIGAQLLCQVQTEGRLDGGAFLLRRVRRLVPPAIPVLLTTLALGGAFFAPQHADALAGAAISAAFGVSNYFFMSELDYFAAPPETKPLLHFWSLSLEAQFYFLCFAAAWAAHRYSRSSFRLRLLAIALGACAASILFAQWLIGEAGAEVAFFDTFARVWELFLGVAIAATTWWRRLPIQFGPPMRAAGLILIALAALRYDESLAGPGAAMLAPTLGAALIVMAPLWDRDPTLILLRTPPMVFLGQVSYSLYLWHWPIFSALHFYFLEVSDGHRTVATFAALALAVLSHQFWELPIRRRTRFGSTRKLGRLCIANLAAVVSIAIALPLLTQSLSAGLSAGTLEMLDEELADLRRRGRTINGRSDGLDPEMAATGGCSFDHGAGADLLVDCLSSAIGADDARPAILFIGDSHARDAFWTLSETHPELRPVYLHHGGGCGVAKHRSLRIGGRLCYAALTELFAALSERHRIDGIALSTRYYRPLPDGQSYAMRSLEARVALGAPPDLPILLFGPSPSFNYALTRYYTSAHPARSLLTSHGALPMTELHFPLRPAHDAMRNAALDAGFYFANRLDAFCGAELCTVIDQETGAPLFADAEHLTRWGRARLAQHLSHDQGLAAFLRAATDRAETAAALSGDEPPSLDRAPL